VTIPELVAAAKAEFDKLVSNQQVDATAAEGAKSVVDAALAAAQETFDAALAAAKSEVPDWIKPYLPMVQSAVEDGLAKEKADLDAKLAAWEATKAQIAGAAQ
jgi:hypothetical protein